MVKVGITSVPLGWRMVKPVDGVVGVVCPLEPREVFFKVVPLEIPAQLIDFVTKITTVISEVADGVARNTYTWMRKVQTKECCCGSIVSIIFFKFVALTVSNKNSLKLISDWTS